MEIQNDLLKIMGATAATVSGIASAGEDKEEHKETTPKAQEEPKQAKQDKVSEVKRASNKSQDALVAAQLQKTERKRKGNFEAVKQRIDAAKKREEIK